MNTKYLNLSMIRIIFFSLILLSACKSDIKPTSYTEILEVYNTIEEGESHRRGDLQHYESKNFKNDRHVETLYYEANGEIKGKEIFIYENSEAYPSKAEYRDGNNNLLSTYTFTYNPKGQKIRTEAYEAGSEELLRVETFTYENDRRKSKEIRNSDEIVQRSFLFEFDGYGNEIAMIVTGATGDTLAVETYEITLRDDNNKWVEKWGFTNDQPSTYQVLKK
jgi:hypothetical protein